MPSACEVCGREPVPVGSWVPEGCRAWLGPRADMDCYRLGYERQRARAEKLEKALREARGHCLGRALCDEYCETIQMIDAALALEAP